MCFKAFFKFGFRYLNDSIANKRKKSAAKKSYEETGYDIKKARKHGYTINAKKQYSKHYKEKTNRIQQQHDNANKFIDDL